MSTKPKGSAAPAPLIKNMAAAPFIYFDNAPLYGATYAGCIEVELSSRALSPKDEGRVVAEMICVAHLRCTPEAALALADALQKAVEMNNKRIADQLAMARENSAGADKAA